MSAQQALPLGMFHSAAALSQSADSITHALLCMGVSLDAAQSAAHECPHDIHGALDWACSPESRRRRQRLQSLVLSGPGAVDSDVVILSEDDGDATTAAQSLPDMPTVPASRLTRRSATCPDENSPFASGMPAPHFFACPRASFHETEEPALENLQPLQDQSAQSSTRQSAGAHSLSPLSIRGRMALALQGAIAVNTAARNFFVRPREGLPDTEEPALNTRDSSQAELRATNQRKILRVKSCMLIACPLSAF